MRLKHLLLIAAPLAATALSLPNTVTNTKRDGITDVGNALFVNELGKPAITDQRCTYPLPARDFNVSRLAGPSETDMAKWYLWASTDGPLPKECECNVAEYGRFENGNSSIVMRQTCSYGGVVSSVRGWADRDMYFGEGSYKVHVGPYYPDACSGPNSIIQKVYYNKPCDPKLTEGTGAYETVIIGTENFDGWFLYSRTRVVERFVVDSYVKDVFDLAPIAKPWTYTDQSKCGAP